MSEVTRARLGELLSEANSAVYAGSRAGLWDNAEVAAIVTLADAHLAAQEQASEREAKVAALVVAAGELVHCLDAPRAHISHVDAARKEVNAALAALATAPTTAAATVPAQPVEAVIDLMAAIRTSLRRLDDDDAPAGGQGGG